jgi:hypothetical protein
MRLRLEFTLTAANFSALDLQELLAPLDVHFYDPDWTFIGDRITLAKAISRRTGINEEALRRHLPGDCNLTDVNKEANLCRKCYSTMDVRKILNSFSVWQRMSWASERITTRPEDEAYCLMGLFEINMPLLYGEGRKAFRRLQEAVLKSSADQSIFAWEHGERYHPNVSTVKSSYGGPGRRLQFGQYEDPVSMPNFAPAPYAFQPLRLQQVHSHREMGGRLVSLTSDGHVALQGILGKCRLVPNYRGFQLYFVALSCHLDGDPLSWVVMLLTKVPSGRACEDENRSSHGVAH